MSGAGSNLTRIQMTTVVVLRVLIGWHFLYEGVAKLTKPGWSAAGFLKQARGPLADLFHGMAANPNVPPALVAFLDKALAKNPDARYPTGEEFAAALRAAPAGGGAPGPRAGGVTSVDIEL